MQNHESLHVWQRARELVLRVYIASQRFPSVERFGLQSQLRRAAISIPANIAEGCSRRSNRDFGRFLQIALGSANEVTCLIDLAHDLGYLDTKDRANLRERTQQVRAMLLSLHTKVGA
ncbi:MAG: four helix bundle protein [Planctomycetota bacterium]|jgi:four helix bundle protein